MAEPYDTLLQVQEHDTALDQLRHRIEAMPERAALAGVRARRSAVAVAMAEVQARVDDLAARQAALEERIAASAERRHELEERMRSGTVTASRTSRPWTTRSVSWPSVSGASRTRSSC